MKIVILGNAGSGKTTLARKLAQGADVLCLDAIAWDEGPVRRPLAASLADLRAFCEGRDRWIVEGCYGDLVEAALPYAEELHFLDPGVAACVTNCRRRPFEPDKFASKEEQDAVLETLLAFVEEYDARDDEFGRARHERIFAAFAGTKQRYENAPVRERTACAT